MGVMQNAEKVIVGLLVIGLVGLLFLIVYGNLSTNLGFAVGSQGYNDTENVIGNLTSGVVEFFSFANIWFVLTAIALLIGIVIGVIALIRKGTGGKGGSFSA